MRAHTHNHSHRHPETGTIIVLTIILALNLLGFLYMGDAGAYLISLFTGIYLINFSAENFFISPYLIILLLWYPCFETLFSILRKNIIKKSPMSPDINHFHQLIFLFIKKKFKFNLLYSNIISANIINLYNAIIFIISVNYFSNSQVQILLILLNLILYTVIYFKIYFNKLRN